MNYAVVWVSAKLLRPPPTVEFKVQGVEQDNSAMGGMGDMSTLVDSTVSMDSDDLVSTLNVSLLPTGGMDSRDMSLHSM